jgi:hypothetical protein
MHTEFNRAHACHRLQTSRLIPGERVHSHEWASILKALYFFVALVFVEQILDKIFG